MTSNSPPTNEIEAELTILIRQYEAWQKEQGLKLGSADEHIFDENLTDAQRKWLKAFSQRWEGASPVHTASGIMRHRDV